MVPLRYLPHPNFFSGAAPAALVTVCIDTIFRDQFLAFFSQQITVFSLRRSVKEITDYFYIFCHKLKSIQSLSSGLTPKRGKSVCLARAMLVFTVTATFVTVIREKTLRKKVRVKTSLTKL